MKPYYEQDGIVIYHGHCLEILPTLVAESVDAVVTDPPYGMGDILTRTRSAKSRWNKHFGNGAIQWDQATTPKALSDALLLAKEAIVWGGHLYQLPLNRGWLVWNKIIRNWSSGTCELAWTNINQPIRTFDYSHGQLANEGKVHPTQKPLPLMEWCLSFIKGETILDPFMGSGTTLVAAKLLGRHAIGIEIEEKYCEIAANRLGQGVLNYAGAV